MLDSFEIITTSGVVLWSRHYALVSPAVVNRFIANVFIEESAAVTTATAAAAAASAGGHATQPNHDDSSNSSNPYGSSSSHAPYRADHQYAVQWTVAKDLGVMFVAVYKSLLHLSWVDKLVDNIRTLFVSLYGDQLTRPHTTVVECARFDDYFDQQLHELEGAQVSGGGATGGGSGGGGGGSIAAIEKSPPVEPRLAAPALAPSADSTPVATPTHSRPSTPGGGGGGTTTALQPGSAPGKMSRRARKAKHAAVAAVVGGATDGPSGDERATTTSRKTTTTTTTAAATAAGKTKKGRKWGVDGLAEEDDGVQLDYSTADGTAQAQQQQLAAVDASTWGTRAQGGQFVLKDLDDEVHAILAAGATEKKKGAAASTKDGGSGLLGTGLSTIGGLFRNVVGGKTLTAADLAPALKGLEEHLLSKNVAREAAVRLCASVAADLEGTRTGTFESIHGRVQAALAAALTKMLTPTSSLDLLREIDAVAQTSSPRRPYVLSIVGVNGVGKSTNLSKICYFLLQNRYRVLVAAGDTFRSGAVEQLAVHVRNLQELVARQAAADAALGQTHGGGRQAAVELFQRGYGKDAAAVAKDAVAHAAAGGFDVVLIDTAGRRHNDARLMASLSKFAAWARPDKIVMVGEALVGTDSVAQARSFNAAFGGARTLDGFLISKCDTVGGMVGTLVSLVHATNVPILFVGVGQHYSDLRNFSVSWAVERLLE